MTVVGPSLFPQHGTERPDLAPDGAVQDWLRWGVAISPDWRRCGWHRGGTGAPQFTQNRPVGSRVTPQIGQYAMREFPRAMAQSLDGRIALARPAAKFLQDGNLENLILGEQMPQHARRLGKRWLRMSHAIRCPDEVHGLVVLRHR